MKFKHEAFCPTCANQAYIEGASGPCPGCVPDSVESNWMPIENNVDMKRRPAISVQVGGVHYKDMAIQPFEYIHRNNIGFAEGSAIKYLSRWKAKGGVEDLKKARHFIDLLIEAQQ